MKLAILSRSLRAYSTQRLKTAALERGHQVKVLDLSLIHISEPTRPY